MLNGDMSQPVVVHTAERPWQDSPGARVKRKRFHLVGAPESGQVTSLVTYLPGAEFPAHPHPDGEEILVLEGVFSDESGDYAAGTHLLNPEGFCHAPYSADGCTLFVKLRQYAGNAHQQLHNHRGLLYELGNETTQLLDLNAEQQYDCPGGFEVFVVEGACQVNGEPLLQYDWVRHPAHSTLKLAPHYAADSSATVYIKMNGVVQLKAVTN